MPRMRAAVYGRQSLGKTKSIDEQLKLGTRAVAEAGWRLAGTYSDAVSASRHSSKPRGGWREVVLAVQSGAFDVLVLWEPSRGDRTPETWFAFLSNCREAGVLVHVINDDHTYDLRKARDWKSLATAGVDSAYESDVISERTKRGTRGAAELGRPAGGPCAYGYRRTYDPATGALVGQTPHPEHAPVVVELYRRAAAHEPLYALVRDLEARGVAPPRGATWHRSRLRTVLTSRTYLGQRKHRGEWLPGDWPALVDPATWHAVQRVLAGDGRQTNAGALPGQQKHLLSFLGTCTAGHWLVGARAVDYKCQGGCVSVKRAALDGLITELAIARLADPEVYQALKQQGAEADARVRAAESAVATLTDRLETWRASAAAGETTPASLAAVERDLTGQIAAQQAVVDGAAAGAVLAGWLGRPRTDVEARWAAAGVVARRAVLRALGVRVVVKPSGRRRLPIHERVAAPW